MRTERAKKLKDYLQNLIIKEPGESYNWQEIVVILASLATIGGAVGMLGGPMGSGIGACVGIALGGGIIITIELVNAYRLYKMEQQPEEEYIVVYTDNNNENDSYHPELAHNNNNSLELDDTDTQSSEESSENNKTPHKPSFLIKVKENAAKLLHRHGLHKSKDPDLEGLTQEENILKPVRLGKHQ